MTTEQKTEILKIFYQIQDNMITLFSLCSSIGKEERYYLQMEEAEKTLFTTEQVRSLFLQFVQETFTVNYKLGFNSNLEMLDQESSTIDDFYDYVRLYMNKKVFNPTTYYLDQVGIFYGENLANKFLKKHNVVSAYEADQVKIKRYNSIQAMIETTLETSACFGQLSAVYDLNNFAVVASALLANSLEQIAKEDETKAMAMFQQFEQCIICNDFNGAMEALGLDIYYDAETGLKFNDLKQKLEIVETYYHQNDFVKKSSSFIEKILGK